MTKGEFYFIESEAWQKLRNCKFYKEKGAENCLRYETGRLAENIHIMINFSMPCKEILDAAKEFIDIQINEKKMEGF